MYKRLQNREALLEKSKTETGVLLDISLKTLIYLYFLDD
jgi:hypothetical protein